MLTHHQLRLAAGTIRYTRCGSGAPIVFIHNGGTSKEIWAAQTGALCDRHEVICLDLLGFGESDLPASGFLLDDYVGHLEAFLKHLDIGPVSVVGNCMGSAMALLLASRRPELFSSLVLINPLTEQTARRGVIGWVMWIPRRLPRLSLAVSRRVRAPRLLGPAIVAAQFGPRHWWRGLRHPTVGARVAGSTWAVRGRLVTMAELFSDTRSLARIDRLRPGPQFPPFATVWGSSNLGLSPRAGEVLNATLRPDSTHVVRHAGHLPMIENPNEIIRIIRDFVENPPSRADRRTSPPSSALRLTHDQSRHLTN